MPITWFPNRRITIKALEKSLRFATRTALGSPYRNDHPNYLSYDQPSTHFYSIEERYLTSAIIMAHKMINEHIKTKLNPSLALQLNQRTLTLNPNTFVVDRRSIPLSPIRTIMEITNKYCNAANILMDTKQQIRNKMMITFTNSRTLDVE